MRDDDDDDDDRSWDEESRGRLNGLRAPEAEYWSDDGSAGGGTAEAGEAGSEAPAAGGPWGAQTQRKLGGPRVEEPITTALLLRLLGYALVCSLCLTSCEVLTMWASRRVGAAVTLGFFSGTLWGFTRFVCLFALPYCWCCVYGLLKYPAVWKEMIPPRRKVLNEMCSSRIYFRHVCMPDDPQHLSQACVAHTVSLLTRALPEVVWRVELVTEGLPFWEPPPAVHVLAVPAEYAPAKGSQGRARAQQYAAQHSEAAPGDWVVHLGAASVLRERTVDAILAHVVDEAFRLSAARGGGERHAAQCGRIAQGPMCVGRTNGSWLGFLSDTRRAGEAHGVFRWQYESTEAWAGVQQTFMLVPKELEQAVGFDHSPRVRGADFTLFALLCRDHGARFSWLDAPTEEPAPLTVTAYVEQRRRAMADRLSILSEGADGSSGGLSVDRRMALVVMTASATCAQLCLVVTALSVFIRHQVSVSELMVSFVISFCSGTMLFCHLLGLATSCSPLSFGGGPPGWVVFCGLLAAQVLWTPAAAFLELTGSAQALLEYSQAGGARRG